MSVDTKALRVSLTLQEEVVLLREQVTRLQTRGTKQLMDARAAAFQAAATACLGTSVVMQDDPFGVRTRCAERIMALSK